MKLWHTYMVLWMLPLVAGGTLLAPSSHSLARTTSPSKHNIHINTFKRWADNFHAVEKNRLYRSRQIHPRRLRKYVKKYHIKTVINLRGKNEHRSWWQREQSVLKDLGVNFFNIPMSAKRLTPKMHIITLLNLYRTAPRPILIHCHSGADRTGEAAALWVLMQQRKGKKKALKQLSIKYGYLATRRPAKKFLINIWQGIRWLNEQYDPANYPHVNR